MIKILITETGYLSQSEEQPEIGKSYILEDANEGSGKQNRAWHSLAMEYFKTGMHSYDVSSFKELKEFLKRDLGEGFEKYIYVDDAGHINDVKTVEEIPDSIRNSDDSKQRIRGKLKSWTDYTMRQRKRAIDNLIAEMLQAGVNTKKFQEILRGLEEGSDV